MKQPLQLSRRRVLFQLAMHVVLVAHVLAYYFLGWKAIGALDFQAFFHHLLGKGLLTAGGLLALLVYGTALIFGRLFCSWGCHFGATQDLAAWLLKRLGWRPPLLRTRFLHWAPYAVLAAVFVLPVIDRWRQEGFDLEKPDLAAVAPWETLPGWAGTVVTFAVCGVCVLFFLGTRGFCRFVCPYGAVFRITDLAAPLRVRKVAHCSSRCAGQAVQPCTAVCPTAIDVHLETSTKGRVTSPDCVRCNLCIEACPSQALAHVTAGTARARLSAAAVGAPDSGGSFRPIGLPIMSASPPTAPVSTLPASLPPTRHDLPLWGEALVAGAGVITYLCADLVYSGHFLSASLALAEGFLCYVVLLGFVGEGKAALWGRPLRNAHGWTFTGITAVGLLALSLAPLFEAGMSKWLRREGLRLDPEASAEPWASTAGAPRSYSRAEKERLEQAAGRYRQAVEYCPNDLETRTLLLSAYARLGDSRALEQAEELHARSQDAASERLLEWARRRFGQVR